MPQALDPVALAELWLPILVAAVLVFLASFVVWMVLPFHKRDYAKLPNEDAVMDALRAGGVGPGMYSFPSCEGDMAKMKDPAFVEKMNRGPVGMLTIVPNGPPKMGAALLQWFLYSLVVGIFVAYLTSHAVARGEDYLAVFRFAGTAAFMGYALAVIPGAIWKGEPWSFVAKNVLDGLLYGLVTGGAFGAMWPGA